jgi:hypothetical protein
MPGPITEESYRWDFPAEVNDILAEVEDDAVVVRTNADQLQALARLPMAYSFESHGLGLMAVREHVNRMGDRLCRLAEIRRVAEPWQQSTIDAVRVALTDLASDTEGAIELLNERQSLLDLYQPVYQEYLAGMYRNAESLCHCSEVEWASHWMEGAQ